MRNTSILQNQHNTNTNTNAINDTNINIKIQIQLKQSTTHKHDNKIPQSHVVNWNKDDYRCKYKYRYKYRQKYKFNYSNQPHRQTQSVEQRRQWLFCCLSGFYVQYNFELMMEIQIQIQVRIQIQYKYKYSYSNQPHNHWSGAVNGCFAAWAASVYHIIYHWQWKKMTFCFAVLLSV